MSETVLQFYPLYDFLLSRTYNGLKKKIKGVNRLVGREKINIQQLKNSLFQLSASGSKVCAERDKCK